MDCFDRAHAVLNEFCYEAVTDRDSADRKMGDVDGQVRGDATCDRIEWLTTGYLEKIAASKNWGEWETLFRDPKDVRYWERTYPMGDMHGGGPPSLFALSLEKGHAKYGFTERASSNNP